MTNFTIEQKQRYVQVCNSFLYIFCLDDSTFMWRIFRGDESWVYGYDPDKKAAVFTVDNPTLSKSKGGVLGQEHDQEHARFHSQDCACQCQVQLQCSKASEGGRSDSLNCGMMAFKYSIKTMHPLTAHSKSASFF